jgi:hypothetical protein
MTDTVYVLTDAGAPKAIHVYATPRRPAAVPAEAVETITPDPARAYRHGEVVGKWKLSSSPSPYYTWTLTAYAVNP